MPGKLFQEELNYNTQKFKLKIYYKSKLLQITDVIVAQEKFANMCKEGCNVYENCWSCPPYSPSFLEIKDGFKKIFVFTSYIYTNQVRMKSLYRVPFIIYNILAPRMHKAGMSLEKELDGLFLKSGPCKICKNCAIVESKPCKLPNKKRYALEATGVDVQKLALLLKHQLLWYTRENLPEYTSVVCGVLTNKNVIQEDIYKNFKRLFIL
jgi:predicted metal-binding protein